LFANIATGENGLHAYFVHSYAFRTALDDEMIAATDYGGSFAAVVGRDNIVGTQFHPEKSQTLGLALIANFLGWRP
jgi:glutamine amidotransferase